MNYQLANLSTDLRRISYWLYRGKNELVKDYLHKIKDKYKIDYPVGPFNNIWQEINLVEIGKEGAVRAADYASTLSSILLQESLKS